MSLKIKIIHDQDELAFNDEFKAEFVTKARIAVFDAAALLLAAVERRLRRRSGTALTAAPQGEPPEYDTGHLARSFHRIRPRVRRGGALVSSGIESRDPGVNRLEFGKTDVRGIRTLPHPFLAPSVAEVEAPIDALIRARFE